ncbi:hypothetical protein PM082_018323 [Marasmius tenuissimus]|nr:hypothetical protein PM082_018323 [Marasmius tenuissimus]
MPSKPIGSYSIWQILMEFGTGIRGSLGTLAIIGGNHWVALFIYFVEQKVYYGDSLGGKIDSELRASYDGWIHQHLKARFKWEQMEVTTQKDSFSCSILAANGLAHRIDPHRHPLLQLEGLADKQLKDLTKVIKQHHEKVPIFPHQSSQPKA